MNPKQKQFSLTGGSLKKQIPVSIFIVVAFSLTLHAATLYVGLSGTGTPPYDTWAKATPSIQTAIDAAVDGDLVLAADGNYMLSSQIMISKGVKVQSASGFANAIVDGNGSTRCFYLKHTNAVVDGFTITHGFLSSADDGGAGAFLYDGKMRNCLYLDNRCANGGAVKLLSNCVVENSIMQSNKAIRGGGAYCSIGGTITNCTIKDNLVVGDYASGGGVYINSFGTVVNCFITNNLVVGARTSGGGVRILSNGLLSHCIVSGNAVNPTSSDGGFGGGVCCYEAAVVRNCLISGNTVSGSESSFETFGAGVFFWLAGATVDACTIVNNRASGTSSSDGGLSGYPGTVLNSIIWGNAAMKNPNWGWMSDGIVFSSTCSQPFPPGLSNLSADPNFINANNGDYHLQVSSPCINAGNNMTWMANAKDLAGNDRIISDRVDLGAWEYIQPSVYGPEFWANILEGCAPLDVIFHAAQPGLNLAEVYFIWDFNNDGKPDLSGFNLTTVTNRYTNSGSFSVSLLASNVTGQVFSSIKTNYLLFTTNTSYVSLNGSHIPPFKTWASASTNIQAAIDVANDGGTVLVNDGTYMINQPSPSMNGISIGKGITLQSVRGYEATILNANSANRCLYLSHSNVIVSGFTIRSGKADSSMPKGGGVYSDIGGTITNCNVVENSVQTFAGQGAGMFFASGGRVLNSVIANNIGMYGNGGGIYFKEGGFAERCIIRSNSVIALMSEGYGPGGETGGGGGGGCFLGKSCVLRNCLIVNNTAASQSKLPGSGYPWAGGGGVYCQGAGNLIQNCTICANAGYENLGGTAYGGGLYLASSSRIQNTIIYSNTVTEGPLNGPNFIDEGASLSIFENCCAWPAIYTQVGLYGNITNPPLFVATDPYHLALGSPCIDSGVLLDAVTFDLDGLSRPVDGNRDGVAAFDIGAYEYSIGSKIFASLSAGKLILTWMATPGLRLQRITNLKVEEQWQDVENTDSVGTFTETLGTTHQFYRLFKP